MIKTVVSYPTTYFNDLLSFCNDENISIERMDPDAFISGKHDDEDRSYLNLVFRDFSLREEVVKKLDKDKKPLWSYIHPFASISSAATLGGGVFIYPFVTVLSGAVVASHTKVHSYCKVAHNAKVGTGTILCSHSNINGSTEVGDYCLFYPYSNIADNLKVVDNCTIIAYSNIRKDITAPGRYAVVNNKIRKVP